MSTSLKPAWERRAPVSVGRKGRAVIIYLFIHLFVYFGGREVHLKR